MEWDFKIQTTGFWLGLGEIFSNVGEGTTVSFYLRKLMVANVYKKQKISFKLGTQLI